MKKGRSETFAVQGVEYTFHRPVWSTMQKEASTIQPVLFQASPLELLGESSPIPRLLKDAADESTQAKLETLFEDGEVQDVLDVWDAYLEFARFRDFFTSLEKKRSEMRKLTQENEDEEQQRQLRNLLKAGISENSIMDLAKDFMPETQT